MSLNRYERIVAVETLDAPFLNGKGRAAITRNSLGNVIGHKDSDCIVQFDRVPKMVVVPVKAVRRINAPLPAHHERL